MRLRLTRSLTQPPLTSGHQVSALRTYTPQPEDVGHALRFECVPVDGGSGLELGAPTAVLVGSRVIAAPQAAPRRLVPLATSEAHRMGRFTVLTYNVLADLYASVRAQQHAPASLPRHTLTSAPLAPQQELYGGYCPPWALSWSYRRQNLLREVLSYNADILCLQEIQSDAFDDFFAPELARAGYAAVYKRKTEQVYTGSAYAIDGCATFYRQDAFTLIKKYEVEFNKAAASVAESVGPPGGSREKAMSRLMKNNVALILVLEAIDGGRAAPLGGNSTPNAKRPLLCVANTHIHANPELNDVKLWQVHTLLKGLEKIAASAEIPMVVCGDFNSMPGSAAHSLLATGRVDPQHPELANDPLGILRPSSKLAHGLPLTSVYAAASRPQPGGDASLPDGGAGVERLRQRLDVNHTGEPLLTNCTRDFCGTLDYIFYTNDALVPTGVLELPDEGALRGRAVNGLPGGLPNAVSSSDHISLLAEMRWARR
jgi:CCR4-NOT transcription complex subunit 6